MAFEPERLDQIKIDPTNARSGDAPDQSEAATGKTPPEETFDERLSGTAIIASIGQSNFGTVLEGNFADFHRINKLAHGVSFNGLRNYKELGRILYKIKALCGHGNFESEVDARLGIAKSWRTSLMKLENNWIDIETAFEWAKAKNRLENSHYSVKGALSLLKAWQNRDKPPPAEKKVSYTGFFGHETCQSNVELIDHLKLLIVFLLHELNSARQQIAFLEAELYRDDVTAHPNAPTSDQFVPELSAVEVAGQ